MLAGILLVGLNMRPAVTSVGAVLDEVRTDLAVSGLLAGLLTSLPVLSFAVMGAFTPLLSRYLGSQRVLVLAMSMLVAGLAVRPLVSSGVVFVGLSAVPLAGIAIANVALPEVVKRHFPGSVGPITGLYTMLVALGTSAGAAFTVPAGEALSGGWRAGLGVWAVVAVGALVPWVIAAIRTGRQERPAVSATATRAWTTGKGWALACFFGLQASQAYVLFGWLPAILRDAGHTPEAAGWLVSLMAIVGAPVALLVTVPRSGNDQRGTVFALMLCYVVAYLGLLFAPYGAAVLWVCLLGVAMGAFPLAMNMLGTKSRTAEGTAALSSFVQSSGYLVGGLAPVAAGWLSADSSSWRPLLVLLLVAVLPQLLAGLAAGGPWSVEDEPRALSRTGIE